MTDFVNFLSIIFFRVLYYWFMAKFRICLYICFSSSLSSVLTPLGLMVLHLPNLKGCSPEPTLVMVGPAAPSRG